MANQKLSKEELEQIKDIQTRMQSIRTELGQLGLAELDLKNRKTNIEDYLKQTQELESELVKSLEDAYGQGEIDTKSGEFIASSAKVTKEVLPTVE